MVKVKKHKKGTKKKEEIQGPQIFPIKKGRDDDGNLTTTYKLDETSDLEITAYQLDDNWYRRDKDSLLPKGIANQLNEYHSKKLQYIFGRVEGNIIHIKIDGLDTSVERDWSKGAWIEEDDTEYTINGRVGKQLEMYWTGKRYNQLEKKIEEYRNDSNIIEMTGELKKQVAETTDLVTDVGKAVEASRESVKATEEEAKELDKRIKETENVVKTSIESYKKGTLAAMKIADKEATLTVDAEKQETLKRIRYAEAEFLVERKNRKNYILALGIYNKILKTDENEIEAWKGAKYISEQLGLEDSVNACEEKIKELEAQ